MKALLIGKILIIVLFGATLFSGCYSDKVLGTNTKKVQTIEIISENRITEDDSIFSVDLIDEKKLVAIMDPSSDIVVFDLTSKNNNGLKILNKQEKSGHKLSDIEFVDSMVGYSVGRYGTLLKTEDGGKSWKELPRFSTYDLTKVKFLNRSVGYIAGESGIYDKKTNTSKWELKIFKTEDGGESWKESYHNANQMSIFDIAILSSKIALASIGEQYLIRTDDGGNSWKKVEPQIKVTSIAFASNGLGWLVNYDGAFMRSYDGGSTWESVKESPEDIFANKWWSISFSNSGKGLAASENGVVIYTLDNGENWKRLPKKINDSLRESVLIENLGLIFGRDNLYKINLEPVMNFRGL